MTSVHATSPGQLWHQVITAGPPPSLLLVLATGLAALVLVGSRRLWPLTRTVVTIAHEGGHALVALAVGRRLDGVRVHRSTAGLTVSAGQASGPGIVATAAAGYLAPPLLGVGTAALLALMIRNAYGIVAVITVAAAVALVIWRGTPLVQAAFGSAMAWFLLLGGIRPVLELQQSRRRSRVPRTDADQLARLTGVPAGVWVTLFALVAGSALVLSAAWLVF
jgi:Peptidase M50B-like